MLSSRRGDQAERNRRTVEAGTASVVFPWWNPDGITPTANCGAWRAKGAANQTASYLNLATLGNANIDPAVVGGVAPTWNTAIGWTFDGATTYLDTGIVPVNDQSWSMLIQYTGGSTSNDAVLAGVIDGPWFLVEDDSAGLNCLYGNGGWILFLLPQVNGNLCVAGTRGYRNGIVEGGVIGAAGGVFTNTIFLGAYNNGGVPGNLWPGNMVAVAVYNVTLTAAQVLARATAMAGL